MRVCTFTVGDRVVTDNAPWRHPELSVGPCESPTPAQVARVIAHEGDRDSNLHDAIDLYDLQWPDGTVAVFCEPVDLRLAPPEVTDDIVLAFFALLPAPGDTFDDDPRYDAVDRLLDFVAALNENTAKTLRDELGVHKPGDLNHYAHTLQGEADGLDALAESDQ